MEYNSNDRRYSPSRRRADTQRGEQGHSEYGRRPSFNEYQKQNRPNGGYSRLEYSSNSDSRQSHSFTEGLSSDRHQQGYSRSSRPANDYSRTERASYRTEVKENGTTQRRRPRIGQTRPKDADTDGRRQHNPSVYSERKRREFHSRYEDPSKPIRLNKYLANAGICSRREADDFILAGVVTVNGETVSQLGARVLPTDKVCFHGQPIRRERKVYVLLNKPKDCVTTTDDPESRHTVMDIVGRACPERIYPVGRLDRNTTGVLLLTNDGDLAAKLTHPKFEKRKVYAATLDKDLTEEDEQFLRSGVVLDDEVITPDALEFTKDDRRHIGLEIHSGQNRVVRRIFEKVGYKVLQLDRVSFAGLTKKNLPRGKFRFLTPKEVAMLHMGAFE